jgi:hypothetical protein
MRKRPADGGQLDLLVRAANALEQNRVPLTIRAEVTLLLTLLMAAYIGADVTLPVEVANE